MIYPIVKFGNPVLERPAEPVTMFDKELKKLVEDMFVIEADAAAEPDIEIFERYREPMRALDRCEAGSVGVRQDADADPREIGVEIERRIDVHRS